MIRHTLKVALGHADSLPSFPSLEEAELSLFQLRDDLRHGIERLAKACGITLDFSPNSLMTLEAWYFDLCESDGFEHLDLTQEEFEHCMGFYNGFVYTENDPGFRWIVEENPFKAERFEIGVTKDLFTLMIGPISHLRTLKNNKRMQSMFREYQKYSTPTEPSER